LLMPVALAVRLLPSDVLSFNLWVAFPLPLAALGMFAFLRRRLPDAAAALGACVFALSGPIASMLNTPNLSWSVALLPWVMWTVEDLIEERGASGEERGARGEKRRASGEERGARGEERGTKGEERGGRSEGRGAR